MTARRSERLLSLLLRLYPAAFRRRFGEGWRHALLEDLAAARARGRLSEIRFWFGTASRTLVLALEERLAKGRRGGASARDSGDGHPVLVRRDGPLEPLARELRHGMRRLARQPWFTLTVVGTLGLGIGATTAIFTVLDGILLSPLPYPDARGLVLLGHRSPSGVLGLPDGGYLYYAEHARTVGDLAAWSESSAALAGMGEPLELGVVQATPSLFPTLGIEPSLGRGLTPGDAQPGAPPVAMVSHGYWERHLGGDRDAVGGPLLQGSPITVVGVLPRGFDFPRPEATFVLGNRFEDPDIFLPLRLNPAVARFGSFMYQAVGRLAGDATPEVAQEELTRLMPAAAAAYPGTDELGGYTPDDLRTGEHRARVVSFKDALVGDVSRVLWILMGAVGIVLVLATLNVANLFLVRTEARRGETAVRRALGAGRLALVRSFLAESLLLAGSAGAVGLLLAWAGTRVLPRWTPDLPRLDQVGVDGTVVAFTASLSLLAAFAFGMAPLLRAFRRPVGDELAERTHAFTAGRPGRRSQDVLVASQVALALVLLVGSGLLLRTVWNLRHVDPGFDPSRVLTATLSLGPHILDASGYDGPRDAGRSRLMTDLADRLAEIPGVESATFTADLPLDGDERRDYVAVEGAVPQDLGSATMALRVFAGPGYLASIGARLREGRELEPRDFADQPRAAVVNETFARQRWGNLDPLGRRIAQYWPGMDPQDDVWYTVVGVVEDVREAGLTSPPEATVYLPTVLLPEGGFGLPVSNFVAVLRTSGDPREVIPEVRRTIRDFDPEIPVDRVESLERLTARSFQRVTFAMVLLLVAGGISLVLGVVGVYGTVAWVVGQRTREFGLRMALGAGRRDVWRQVLLRAGLVGGAGVILGSGVALVTARVLDSLLFEVGRADPAVYAVAGTGVLALVLVASLTPAARAASVDPATAMRAN